MWPSFQSTCHELNFTKSEFSPPLDTSLIAAIVADYINETTVGPPHTQIQALRQILAELAAQAEAEQDDDHISDDFARLQLSSTDDNTSMTDFFAGSSTNTAATSTVSSISQQSFSSPLGFLQAAFPHLPVSRLKSALGSAQDEDEVDMESVVNDIMSSEVVRELEERGLEEEKGPEAEWELTQSTKKKKRKAGKTFTLVDVRQRQHIQTPTTSRPSTHDAWTQLSSVTSHLETLLPTQSASYFLSFFHSPIYRSPSDALRASFLSMSASCSSESKPEETHTLFLMFDVIRESPDYVSLPDVDRERMMDDAQLALHATQGNADAAIDIVWLLRELDAGDIDAIYHSPVPTSPISPNGVNMKSKHASRLPAGPPTVQPPRLKARVVNTPVIPKPPPNAWKTVPAMPKRGPNPHAEFIPAYKPNKTPATSNGKKKGNAHRGRASELEQQRREALRQASRAWQRGNSHSRGGEVALYFAERVRLISV